MSRFYMFHAFIFFHTSCLSLCCPLLCCRCCPSLTACLPLPVLAALTTGHALTHLQPLTIPILHLTPLLLSTDVRLYFFHQCLGSSSVILLAVCLDLALPSIFLVTVRMFKLLLFGEFILLPMSMAFFF